MEIINFDTQRKGEKPKNFSPLREKLHDIVFESETRAGKLFDITLLAMIMISIALLMLETLPTLPIFWRELFYILEWVITFFFTIEYIIRLYSVYKPSRYAMSFFGIIDIASILPMYLGLFFPAAHSLMIVRSLRLLRLFRIFKLDIFLNQGTHLVTAMKQSREKILVFLFFVLLMVCIFGSLMYVVENRVNPKFDSIPTAIYWAIVTITTVGYGDISPVTGLGKLVASFIMILGYAVIAVPTGIVTASLIEHHRQNSSEHCKNCGREGHEADALYCKFCGYSLKE